MIRVVECRDFDIWTHESTIHVTFHGSCHLSLGKDQVPSFLNAYTIQDGDMEVASLSGRILMLASGDSAIRLIFSPELLAEFRRHLEACAGPTP